ncbi:DNA-directed RNA polymerase iii subunit rpc4 [Anaeramoeba flamelloides]|uniref:DNA-directed RNA polymerase iii subunit rpc4 n=1 Tax=Anaeramoeba flamelloides TaxID=1746091 RepID=A0ABQ8ZB09_9EUKA|nr:DNA-directed RNA polymerase iii subunit rpc4 [Anaeramoeba flamelloides]
MYDENSPFFEIIRRKKRKERASKHKTKPVTVKHHSRHKHKEKEKNKEKEQEQEKEKEYEGSKEIEKEKKQNNVTTKQRTEHSEKKQKKKFVGVRRRILKGPRIPTTRRKPINTQKKKGEENKKKKEQNKQEQKKKNSKFDKNNKNKRRSRNKKDWTQEEWDEYNRKENAQRTFFAPTQDESALAGSSIQQDDVIPEEDLPSDASNEEDEANMGYEDILEEQEQEIWPDPIKLPLAPQIFKKEEKENQPKVKQNSQEKEEKEEEEEEEKKKKKNKMEIEFEDKEDELEFNKKTQEIDESDDILMKYSSKNLLKKEMQKIEKTSQYLQDEIGEFQENEFYWLQLPPILPISFKSGEKKGQNKKLGGQIGTLRIHKSGKVSILFKGNDLAFDIFKGTTPHHYQSALFIDKDTDCSEIGKVQKKLILSPNLKIWSKTLN